MARNRLSALLPFLLVTLFCVGSVELFYRSLEKYLFSDQQQEVAVQGEVRPEPAQQSGPPARQEVSHEVITRRNLFGPPPAESGDQPSANEPVVEEELEKTTLELVLMGTIDGVDDQGRAIILKKKDRSQDLYKVGDVVEGALVKEISRGRVIINVDGRDELLDINEARQFVQSGMMPAVRAPVLRRRPVVEPEGASGEADVQAAPRVVRPLRRIVRPRIVTAPSEENDTPERDLPEEEGEADAALEDEAAVAEPGENEQAEPEAPLEEGGSQGQ